MNYLPKNKIIWTDEMEQFIRDNYKGMSDKEIGKVLFVSGGTVKKKRCRMKINRCDKRKIPKDVLEYGIDLVSKGETYSSAARKCNEKFGISVNVTSIMTHCEKAGVLSNRANKNFIKACQTEDKYEKLEAYNKQLVKLKNEIQVGDKIKVVASGNKVVVGKYPNFVICITCGFKEAIQYTDIREIIR